MGFLDVLTGKRKIKGPAPDRVFAMATAGVALEMSMALKPGQGGDRLPAAGDQRLRRHRRRHGGGPEGHRRGLGTTIEKQDDKFGYRWMILADPDFEDLVVGVNGVSTALQAGGYGDRVLAAVFAFRDAAGQAASTGSTTTSAARSTRSCPAGGAQQRDSERELQLQAQIGAELPVEAELERWFPLWDIPIC